MTLRLNILANGSGNIAMNHGGRREKMEKTETVSSSHEDMDVVRPPAGERKNPYIGLMITTMAAP